MYVNIYYKHKDIIINSFIIASRAYLQQQKDMLVNASGDKHAYEIRTRSGATTQDPLYPEGHPKRIEQDSQQPENRGTSSKGKKKKHKTVEEASEPVVDPN